MQSTIIIIEMLFFRKISSLTLRRNKSQFDEKMISVPSYFQLVDFIVLFQIETEFWLFPKVFFHIHKLRGLKVALSDL